MDRVEAAVLGARSAPARGKLVAARHDQHVWETTADPTTSMLRDVADALRRWPLWVRLGWQDVLLRYRRSLLGPFWLTLSMGIMIVTLGSIYGQFQHLSTTQYMPFLATGMMAWTLMSALVTEGCQSFIESDWLIRQIDLPRVMFPIRVVWRNLIVFLHHLVIYLVVLLLVPLPLRWTALTAIAGVVAVLVNGLWWGISLGMLSARFRDMPQIVASLMQVVFFATPIIWSTEAVTGNDMLWNLNPFFHLIQIVRAPLLGFPVPRASWLVVAVLTVAGWLLTIVAFRRFHRRISYWV